MGRLIIFLNKRTTKSLLDVLTDNCRSGFQNLREEKLEDKKK